MKLKQFIIIGAFCMTGCVMNHGTIAPAPNGVRDFCIDTACNSLENSGCHYQAKQQGYFMGPQDF